MKRRQVRRGECEWATWDEGRHLREAERVEERAARPRGVDDDVVLRAIRESKVEH